MKDTQMTGQPKISVIVPLGSPAYLLSDIRRQVFQNTAIPKELVFVASCRHEDYWRLKKAENEKWIFSCRTGRGCFLYQGACQARGEILLFLHADTQLPQDWDSSLCAALRDNRIAGGGFSLQFDRSHLYLRLLIRLSDLFYWIRKELWGDRALFIRLKVLQPQISRIDVPLMEDVALSSLIRQAGRMCLLRDKVTTSARHFYQRGLIRHTLLILFCRLMYALGISEQRLFDWYYPEKERKTIRREDIPDQSMP